MFSVVTWNLNSIRSRIEHLLAFLEREKPDVVLLQELKLETAMFPTEPIEALGYNCAVYGQKTYNGVAILSRHPLQDVVRGLPCDVESGYARYIEAVVSLPQQAVRVASIYVPNGQSVDSDKFIYKLNFMQCLLEHTQKLLSYEEILVMGGDYNIAPSPMDVYNPRSLDGTVCYHPVERAALRKLTSLGLSDAWRLMHPQEKTFSWWDYRQNGYERNAGLRIDHLLLSPEATDKLHSANIDQTERQKEKPSDHAAVMCQLNIAA